jgi:acetyl esterase
MTLDPSARALLRMIAERNLPPMESLPPAVVRKNYREGRVLTQPLAPDVGESRDFRISGPSGEIPLRLYRPQGCDLHDQLPVLVFYHGGGWVFGDLDTHDTLCRELANGSGCAVVAVDYRLGPEHRFPAAVDDAFAAAKWVYTHARELDLNPYRIAVGGDSSGGNLAAVVALLARDAGDLPLAFQMLIYPSTDLRCGTASHKSNGTGYLLTSASIAWCQDHYMDDPRHKLDWRASPLLHEDLAGLPPALILTAGYDPLRDEGQQYAQRLSEAGVRATLLCFERQIHGFITMGKVIDEANTAVRLCAAELRHALA